MKFKESRNLTISSVAAVQLGGLHSLKLRVTTAGPGRSIGQWITHSLTSRSPELVLL